MFLPFECRDKMACFDLKGHLFGVQKFSLQDCPKILLHLFEEDTLLFLSVGKLLFKAVYQEVVFVSEIIIVMSFNCCFNNHVWHINHRQHDTYC